MAKKEFPYDPLSFGGKPKEISEHSNYIGTFLDNFLPRKGWVIAKQDEQDQPSWAEWFAWLARRAEKYKRSGESASGINSVTSLIFSSSFGSNLKYRSSH